MAPWTYRADSTGSGAAGISNTVLDAEVTTSALQAAVTSSNNLFAASGQPVSVSTAMGFSTDVTAPTVSSVTSTLANGSYTVGQVVPITINFSEPVMVTGTPTLTLNTTPTARTASYSSGSGTTALVFNYTVAATDTSADLDYAATTSLALAGGTIKDLATNAAALTLASPGAANSLGANKNIVIDTTAPTVSSVSSSTANGSYTTGSVIAVTITFSENVTVTGTPQLTLNTTPTARTANYASGSGTSTLTFNYTVQAGDTAADLDYSATTALALNGGTIQDAATNNATLTLATPGAANSLGANKNIVIDTTAPTVSSVTSTLANGSYTVGQVVPITINFSEPVVVTGTPTLTLNTTPTARTASYSSGSGTTALVFNYTVAATDTSADLDYAATTSLALAGGTIQDAATNNATLTLATPGAANSLGANKSIVIDTTAPTVSSVTSTLANGSYTVGQVVPITINFSEPVVVTGTPTLTLNTSPTARTASYSSGSGTATLVFNYTVAATDTSADLDYAATTSLALAGGTIQDAATNNATLTLATPGAANSLGANKSIVIDTTAPTVSSVTSTLANGSYTVGQVVPITINFSEPVMVTGTPTLTLNTSPTARTASYSSGSGTATLVFNYTVAATDTSADLDYAATTSLALAGGTIQDAATNNATLTLATPGAANSLGANKSIVIDTTAPTVSSVTSTLANGSYTVGQVVPITINFSEPVMVTGTPTLTLNTSPTARTASYSSGSGTATLVFNYTVAATDTSADLDYAATTSLALAGGTIQDAATNNATLTLATPGAANSLGANKSIVIDTTAPTVSSVTSTLANGSYTVGQVVPITINFSEPVMVTGTPTLTLNTSPTARTASYSSGSGTATLVFNYTVAATDTSADLDYAATTSLALAGGTIQDAATNNATLTLATPGAANSLGANKSIVIDTTAPTVSSVTSTLANGSYTVGQVVPITINFSEPVMVTGTPTLTLNTSPTARTASYSSGSGTATLVFNYTVAATDTSADLDYAATTSLALAGGTIQDAATNNATLTLATPGAANSLGANKSIVIDTTAPTVSSVTSTLANGSYTVGQVVPITINFSEPVMVTGTPTLTLNTSPTARTASYSSGSGTATLVFNYTVAATDTSADLDYAATTSLALAGGTIQDAATNNATLTLATPGAANSLGANKSIVIDTTAPTVSSVTSTLANGSYTVGQVVPITINFSEPVMVTGTPTLTLNTSPTARTASYSSGSGTATLVFNYTVAATDTSADLDYAATTSLALAGGTIQDAATNNATLTLATPGAANSLGANKSIVIDTTAPTVSSVTSTLANGSYTVGQVVPITINFSEPVMVTGTPTLTLNTSPTARTASYSSGSGTATLVFNYTVAATDTSADLDYAATTSLALAGGTIQDAATNNATLTLATPGAANSLGANKSIVIDTTAPTVSSVTSTLANGSYTVGQVVPITINFSEPVMVTGTPTLTLNTSPTARTASYSSGSGTATLVFNYTVAATDTSADLDYAATTSLALAGGTIQDAATNNATLTLATPGAANSLGANKSIVIDTTAPTVSSVTSTLANGSYTVGQVVPITINFSEPVMVTGTPTLTLNTSPTARTASYSSGSGTATLVFNYTVAATDTSADLDYAATTSLALAGGTIQDAATNNATLTLATPGAANSLGANKSIVIDTTAPTVSSVTSTLANGSYTVGQVVPITINFSEPVMVTGTPTLTLNTSPTARTASYSSGSGTATLVFNYTVAATDTSADLDYAATTSLALAGGTIQDAATNNATLTLATPGAANSLGANKSIVIDTTAPTVSSVTSTLANGSYTVGQVVPITINFSEPVMVTGTPTLTLNTSPTARTASYSSGSGTATLVFNYTVAATDTSADLDYAATTSLALAGGTIQDAATNNATLTLATPGAANSLGANKSIVIDTTAPTVSSVTSTLANGSYTVGQVVPITINFSEPVMVTGTPTLTLNTSPTARTASYSSGSGTATLVFNYTVAATDTSADLDYAATTSLALAGGTIQDAATNNATLTLATPGAANSLGANKSIVIDTTAPTVSSVTSTLANGSYTVGQVVPITINFSEPVMVTGTPTLTLNTSPTARTASYSSGSGTATLVFNYTVAATDTSADLDYAATTSLALAGGTIQDAATNNATLTLATPGAANSLGANKSIVIDTTAPTVSSVTSTLANGSYTVGQVVPITINFSEPVMVTGTPTLTLNTSPTARTASYSSGSGTATLVFNYTVAATDTSADLDYAATTSLALAGGTIQDAATNNATLTLATPGAANSLGANKSIVIDTTAPTVSSVTSTLANGSYTVGQVVPITINFSEPVMVTGTPTLTLNTSPTARTASYSSGSGTATLVFNYTVAATDTSADLDYAATTSLALAGGTIQDAATNNATLTLATPGAANSLGANKSIVIDTTAPTVSSVTSTLANGSYTVGQVVPITINFSEPVMVTGTPTLTLNTTPTARTASYSSGSGTTALVFNYTVAATDTSADLDYAATTSLALAGGTIKDLATNAAALTLASPGAANSLGANKNIVIDTTAPTVSSVSSSTANGSYTTGSVIAVTITFSENVTVTGTPQLTLNTTPTARTANYASGSGTSTLTFNYTVQAG